MLQDGKILVGKGENPVYLLPALANRHGLIAGATGTGKTATLKVLAEGLSDLGVPVFLADIKGDVSGTALAGTDSDKMQERLQTVGVDPASFRFTGYPCRFWDVFGKGGIPVRATVTDVGPLLLARLLDLTPAQEGVLNIVFRVADDAGLELLDFKDLRSMLTWVGEHRKDLTTTYGNITTQTVGAIQRALLALENDGAETFFGEPQLDIADWINTAADGRGTINILHCVELAQKPLLYATFMLWMLSELYEALPEVGDAAKPKLVFFFDEAHMLFSGAPKALVDKVVQVVKLIRSKGVGIFFITQSPADIPDAVLAQLNNRVQHALRAYTPAEQKAVRTAAQSFRPNPKFKTEDAISGMGTGVALVSMLDEAGVPTVVEQATICPPQSSMNGIDLTAKVMLVANDALYPKYKDAVDNWSAYEALDEVAQKEADELAALKAEQEAAKAAAMAEKEAAAAAKAAEKEAVAAAKAAEREAAAAAKAQAQAERDAKKNQTQLEKSVKKAAKSTVRTFGRNLGKKVTRGLLSNSNKTVRDTAANFTGSLVSDLLGNLF